MRKNLSRASIILLNLLSVTILFVSGCNEAQEQEQEMPEPRYNPEQLFPEYRITGTEERGEATVNIRFHKGAPDGRAVRLPEPAMIALDGAELAMDSSKMNGIYYEHSAPLEEFEKPREIAYKTKRKVVHKTAFELPLFTLQTEIPAQFARADLLLGIEGVEDGTMIHAYFTDTSYMSRGLERMEELKDGKLLFTKNDLRAISNGPVQLELYIEREKEVENEGWISIYYGLTRDFLLVDSIVPLKRKRVGRN